MSYLPRFYAEPPERFLLLKKVRLSLVKITVSDVGTGREMAALCKTKSVLF